MSRQTVNLDTYSLSLLTAKEDILNHRSSTNWALFVYEGLTNKLKLADSGVGGVAELASKFHASKPQYGLCRVGSAETGGPRVAMIAWVGEHVEEYRRTECAGHIPAIKHFFKEAHAFISAHKADDVTEEKIRAELSKNQAHPQWTKKSSRFSEREDIVGTNYRKTNAAMEMRLINRDSFWARAEREEELRKEEERRRAVDERRRLERERVLKERKESEERDRKMNEKLQMIEEQRQKQAEQQEELRRKEKFRWEQQQREHEDDMRAHLRRSESIEKAAEAAVLVSQRSMNPREFFRQLSSSSSRSPTSPGSSRAGKPFRRYQRSLTDTAFIFSKAEDSTPSSPLSSPFVSPFSRASPSPIGATSPPTSPIFRPVTSPTRTKFPQVSPPMSPLRNAPPTSAPVPVVSPANQQHVVETKAPSPTEPSAPPVSINLEASSFFVSETSIPTESLPGVLPPSPPNTPTEPELSTFCFGGPPPQPPSSPLPEIPQLNTDLHTSLFVHTDTGYKAQAVLLEVDEEEDDVEEKEEEEEEEEDVKENEEQVDMEEKEEEEPEVQPQTCISTDEPVQAESEEQMQVKEEQMVREEESEQEVEPASPEETTEKVCGDEEEVNEDSEHNDRFEDRQSPDKLGDLLEKEEKSELTGQILISGEDRICQTIKLETVVLPSNGFTNGEENGIGRSLSPSDAEISSPELSGCYDLHNAAESDDIGEEKEMSENGQEVLAEQQICVRALYDYHAEDDSEISFEPGDIIRDVETVDKAWWRGWSKDGRQGLFPANYVEPI
ncbi:drebrin-like protein A isoform X1 [Phyllopteryx taeniolatus]|uniref:drebrin-like protein A isoform X1 n=2 Tax=Phyllopteryx taeniolatus TaxID=161469 RepID=UPI002AD2C220|nr:drebrin-like protein A isoform X1 [Phyllopteryx taeniolatus]